MRKITAQDLQDIRDHFPLEACLLPPDLTVAPEAAQAFDRLFDDACSRGPAAVSSQSELRPAAEIAYSLPYPKYLFLEYLASTRGLMLHGSNVRAIDVLRPIRQTTDSSEFGNQDAIYATQDPFWALFFAVLDKTGLSGTSNGALQLLDEAGMLIRRYYFTLEVNHLRGSPWKPGAVYILPGAGFEPDPTMLGVKAGPYSIQVTHWIHRGALQPLAWLPVDPQDFPFLHSVWGYDLDAYLRRMSEESLAGFPYLDDAEVYPVMPERGR